MNGAILQLTLKSMYEGARSGVWRLSAYQQLQADLYFLFHTCFDLAANSQSDFLPTAVDETFPVFSGLFNEVMSSGAARYSPVRAVRSEAEGGSEGAQKKEVPASLEEALLQAMTQVKRDQMN